MKKSIAFPPVSSTDGAVFTRPLPPQRHKSLFLLALALLSLGFFSHENMVAAMFQAPAEPAATPKQDAAKDKKEIEIPKPKEITLNTKDGVILKCTYLESPHAHTPGDSKEVMPFILIHDWEGDRQDLVPFGKYLQSLGCSVIVPDLRGHGESTSLVGSNKTLDYKTFRKTDFALVVKDFETCKRYLMQRNNDGELNIDLLNLVVVGESAVFGLEWTISDWSWPPAGSLKQGQDVKSITLISPKRKLKNLNAMAAVKNPLFSGRVGINLPTLIVWADGDATAARDAIEIHQIMEKGRPDVSQIEDAKERSQKTTLYKAAIPNTRATGSELIRDNEVTGFWKYLAKFVDSQVGAKKGDFRWESRQQK